MFVLRIVNTFKRNENCQSMSVILNLCDLNSPAKIYIKHNIWYVSVIISIWCVFGQIGEFCPQKANLRLPSLT